MKKKTLQTLLAATFGVFISFAAHADGECDRYKSEYDQTYCFSKLFMDSDSELNQVYNELSKTLKPGVRQQLKDSELAWMNYRNDTCSAGGTIAVDCNYKANRDRAEYLRDRLRECKAGTCRDSEIVKHSWH